SCRSNGVSDPRALHAWSLARQFAKLFTEIHARFSDRPTSKWSDASLEGVLKTFEKVVAGAFDVHTSDELRAVTYTTFKHARTSEARHAAAQQRKDSRFRESAVHTIRPVAEAHEFSVPNRERFLLWVEINKLRLDLT